MSVLLPGVNPVPDVHDLQDERDPGGDLLQGPTRHLTEGAAGFDVDPDRHAL